nr:hypothetical protein GCM10020093_034430 [Planobispora longispora]
MVAALAVGPVDDPDVAAVLEGQRAHEHDVADLHVGAPGAELETRPDDLHQAGAGHGGQPFEAVLVDLPVLLRQPLHEHDLIGVELVQAAVEQRVVHGLVPVAALEVGEHGGRVRVVGHADVEPDRPVDRQHPGAARGLGLGVGVHDGVGGAVVAQAEVAGEDRDRRVEHEQVEGVAEDLLDRVQAADLGGEDLGGVVRRAGLQHAAAGHAGGVEDAVDRAERLLRAPPDLAHRGDVGDVGGDGQHVVTEVAHLADAAGDRVVVAVRGQVGVPVRALGQPGAADEDDLGPDAFDEVAGEHEAESAEPAGDHVDAAVAQPRRGRGPVEVDPVVAPDPALAAAVGDLVLLAAGDLGGQPERVGRRVTRPGEVDAAAGDAGQFLGDEFDQAEQGGLGGLDGVLAGHVVHVGGDQDEIGLGRAAASAGECLQHVEHAVEAQVEPALRAVGGVRGRPAVHDRQPVGAGDGLQEGRVVGQFPGVDGDVAVDAGRHRRDHREPGGTAPPDQFLGDAAAR